MNRNSVDILAALKEQPDDPELHSELFEAFAEEGAWGSPDRFACILWMVRHDPGNRWCVTPFAHVAPELAPEAFREIRAAWLDRASSADVDAPSLRGAALFVAAYFTHQAHTALGAVALKRGDAAAAVAHLESSLGVRPDARLGAYGPASLLVRARSGYRRDAPAAGPSPSECSPLAKLCAAEKLSRC